MEEESTARNVYAKRVSLEERCRITGELQYVDDLSTEEGVTFAKEPVKANKLPSPPI
jgi:hypothetical protein